MSRIERITRCTDELAQCSAETSIGAMVGWMDWHAELHRLLYETER